MSTDRPEPLSGWLKDAVHAATGATANTPKEMAREILWRNVGAFWQRPWYAKVIEEFVAALESERSKALDDAADLLGRYMPQMIERDSAIRLVRSLKNGAPGVQPVSK